MEEQARPVSANICDTGETDLPKNFDTRSSIPPRGRLVSTPPVPDRLSDSELWPLILRGDDQAWKIIVFRYRKLVYSVLTTHHLSLSDAADCFQQTWVLLYQNRSKLQDPSRLSSWLITTAKREAMRTKRRTARYVDGSVPADYPDQRLLPDDELCQLELQTQIETAVDALSQKCRKLVTEFFFAPEDRSYEEIAHSLGLAPNTIGPFRRRCLEQLRGILADMGCLDERNRR